jgi:hypothetical protein
MSRHHHPLPPAAEPSSHPAARRPPAPAARALPAERRLAGTACFVCVALLVSGTLLAARPDIASTYDVHHYLDGHGPRLLAAWAAMTLAGMAWLLFVAAERTLMPSGPRRDLFTLAATGGQICVLIGAALATAPAPDGARELSLSTYLALDEASHLSSATGLTLIGLALLSLASIGAKGVGTPRWFVWMTRAVGAVLVVASVAGPVSTPLLTLWILATAIVLVRRPPVAEAPPTT